ncbi:DUF4255 domain-containing protein [Paracoccus aminovorans]|uniref:DUF4255 domain-containing protein n=1 Tax=Paracoccus aminovorans TaxID=34004 RepID=UPI002B25CBCE|nr:DUF4255 domain-containing protein [Paracoccus aminovorans]
MSNALAIAGVTAILRDRLNDGLLNANLDSLGQFSVTSSPPDRLEGHADPANRLNIYMWNVTRNAAWSTPRLPARSAAGERIDNPFLALDLHYILTATGAEDLNAEILLGYGMQVLHETPVLTRADIRASLGGADPAVDASLLPAPLRLLVAADLADQFEQIRISPAVPESRDLGQIEALSNIWSAFSAPMRASALYQVGCVLIESRRPARSALPVLTIGGRTAPLRGPRIARVAALPGGAGGLPDPMAAVLPGGWIAVEGTALAAERMRVMLGTRALAVAAADLGDRRIDLRLPADQPAGIARIMVDHLFIPAPGQAERLWESSNALPFAIAPVVTAVARAGTVAAGRFTGTVTLTLANALGERQAAAMLFNPLTDGAQPAFSVPARTVAANRIRADLAAVPAGAYVVRAEIDGAASLPTLGAQGFDGPVADLDP